MNTLNVKKGDQVVVLTGKDKGKKGTILACDPSSNRVIVKEVNIQKKHIKARNARDTAGIVEMEGPIDASNVMIICPKCGKATRVAHKSAENGKKTRNCKKCGAELVFAETKKESKKAAKKAKKEDK